MSTIDISEIKPNSFKYKEETEIKIKEKLKELDLEKVEGEDVGVKTKQIKLVKKKPSWFEKVSRWFISEDVDDIKSYLIFDLIIPGVKDVTFDLVEMMLFGEKSGRRKRGSSKVSYSGYYDRKDRRARNRNRNRDREDSNTSTDYKDIVVEERGDAEDIVDRMQDLIDRNGKASIADLLDLVNLPSNFADVDWGWTNPRSISYRRVRDGYKIDVDRVKDIGDI
nr:MAG TPA: hypothetical protein [Caudoviricetes sp.]